MQVQRRCRITACRRLDQRLEIGEQRGVLGNRRFASGSRPPDPLRGLVSRQFLQTPPDRARRNPGCHRDRRDPAITRGERLGRRDQTAAPFIEKRGHRRKPPSDGSDIDHYHNMWYSSEVVNDISNSIKSRFDNFRAGPYYLGGSRGRSRFSTRPTRQESSARVSRRACGWPRAPISIVDQASLRFPDRAIAQLTYLTAL